MLEKQQRKNKIKRRVKATLAVFFIVLTFAITYLPFMPSWDTIYAAVGLREKTSLDFDPRPLTLSFIDVGQGDSCFIWTENTSILIDTGPKGNGQKIVNTIKSFNVTELDYLIITHQHEDHIGSLEEVKNYLNSNNIEIKNEIIPDETTVMSDLTITPEEDLILEFLGPVCKNDDLNNMSLVIKLTYKNTSVLLVGDAEEEEELSILRTYGAEKLKSDVLKVGHHGSKSSSSEAFLLAVSPKLAVISVGAANDYGHPHAATLLRLAAVGATVYRTDECGTIYLSTDGSTITKK